MAELSNRAIGQLGRFIRKADETARGNIVEDSRASADRTTNAQPLLLGKAVADVAKGSSERVEIWSRENIDDAKGTEVPTGEFIESVFCRTDNILSTDLQYLFFVDGGYEMNKAEC